MSSLNPVALGSQKAALVVVESRIPRSFRRDTWLLSWLDRRSVLFKGSRSTCTAVMSTAVRRVSYRVRRQLTCKAESANTRVIPYRTYPFHRVSSPWHVLPFIPSVATVYRFQCGISIVSPHGSHILAFETIFPFISVTWFSLIICTWVNSIERSGHYLCLSVSESLCYSFHVNIIDDEILCTSTHWWLLLFYSKIDFRWLHQLRWTVSDADSLKTNMILYFSLWNNPGAC